MPTRLIASKNGKRLVKESIPDPAYLWLPISLLAPGDWIVTAQQEVRVKTIAQPQQGTWSVELINPRTHMKESYQAHQFLYTKATDVVKARVRQNEKART